MSKSTKKGEVMLDPTRSDDSAGIKIFKKNLIDNMKIVYQGFYSIFRWHCGIPMQRVDCGFGKGYEFAKYFVCQVCGHNKFHKKYQVY